MSKVEEKSEDLQKGEVKSLAYTLMQKNRSVKERASSYFTSVKRNIERDVINTLIAEKEAIEDKIFELTNFNLVTDKNAGMQMMTKDECEQRFKTLIELEYQLVVKELELTVKTQSFNKYFN